MPETTRPLTPEEEKRLADMTAKVLRGESILRAELKLGTDEMEALYALCHNVYLAGKYEEAVKMFGLLSLLDPADYRFVFGGASALRMLGQYMAAGMYFQLAAGLNVEEPAPMLHTAECLLAIEDRDGARAALEQALERAGSKEAHAPLRRRAEVMLENLAARESA
jgi:type III secretion system low calcium response chaperone LcrH/SycD